MPFFDSRAALYAFMAVLTLVVLIGHHSVPPMDRDESRFAQASRQMQQDGDYVTVRFQDDLRAKKPAGIYWLQTAFANLFGPDDIAAYRFVNLLALLAAVFILYHIGLRLYEPRASLAASTLLGVSFIVLGEAHLAKTDSVLMTLAICQQWALMSVYISAGKPRAKRGKTWFWFWLAMAGGIMIKGPVLVVLAVATVLTLCLWDRRLDWLVGLRSGYGILLVCVVCLPWALLVTEATRGEFLGIAIKGDLLAKVKSGQESHGAPPGIYMLILGFLIWPASPLLVSAVTRFKGFLGRVETRFLLAWLLPFWVILEFIPTKLPHYILPVLPALMLLLAGNVIPPAGMGGYSWRGFLGNGLRYFGAGLGLCFGGVAVWGAINFGGVTSRSAMLFSMATLVCAVAALWFAHYWITKRLWSPFFAMLGAGMMLHVVFFSGVIPALSRLHISTAIVNKVVSLNQPPAAIAAAGYHEPSLVFHLGQDLLLVDGREAALFLVEAPGGLAIVEMHQNEVFLATAAELGLRLKAPIQLEGYNISKGQNVEILLYRTEMFDAKAGKG